MDDHSASRRSRSGRPDPADRRQLEDSPVSLTRIARLFAPHRAVLAVVVGLIATGLISAALGGAPKARAVTRNVLMGLATMAATYLVGVLFGVAAG